MYPAVHCRIEMFALLPLVIMLERLQNYVLRSLTSMVTAMHNTRRSLFVQEGKQESGNETSTLINTHNWNRSSLSRATQSYACRIKTLFRQKVFGFITTFRINATNGCWHRFYAYPTAVATPPGNKTDFSLSLQNAIAGRHRVCSKNPPSPSLCRLQCLLFKLTGTQGTTWHRLYPSLCQLNFMLASVFVVFKRCMDRLELNVNASVISTSDKCVISQFI